MQKNLVISSESDAFALLEDLVKGVDMGDIQVELRDWPVLIIQVEGKDFAGTIPTRIMHPLLELQRQVNRVYAEVVYGDAGRRLSQEEREGLELIVQVSSGSSKFQTPLDKPLLEILKKGMAKMNGSQVTIVVLTFAVIIGTNYGWTAWLNERLEEKRLAQTIELSQLEQHKLDVVRQALIVAPQAKGATDAAAEVQGEWSRRLRTDDRLVVPVSNPDDDRAAPAEISGETARQVIRTERETPLERVVEDRYRLRVADFSKPGVVRVELTRVSDGYNFRADVLAGAMTNEQEQALRDHGWKRQELILQLVVKDLHGRYTSAKVVAVKTPI